MTCDDARLLIGADPGATTPELEEHLATCAACARFREEMRALDAEIRRALERPPDTVRPRSGRPSRTWRQWALAASVVLASFAVLAVWLLRPSDTLAREVVAHVQAEPESWLATQHVSAQDIGQALRGAGVALDVTSDRVMYAQSCWFRGHYVPHLVIQTARGPATVLILRHEQVRARRSFHEAGMTGLIIPAEHGSIAVLTRGAGDPADIAGHMQHEVHWLPDAR
ncbi:MAG TPA: DUF3379 family protein [Steroidobacteraceae bacterium]|nr:DUF3379 family protein [Steroidobacteraceae bacterium]